MKVRITVIKPNNEEKRLWYDTPTEITIGRSQNCTCSIEDDPMVSRMHAVLLVDPPAIRLKDLNSTNGVVINGELYGGYGNEKLLQATLLREGDELMVGNTMLRIAVVEDIDQPESSPEPETVIRPGGMGDSGEPLPIRSIAVPPARTTGPAHADYLDEQGGSSAPVDLNLLAPAIPGYEISTFVGSGRTGSVYRAVNLDTGQDVAIKVMFPELAFTRKMADAFRLGVDTMKRVHSPALVRYLGSGDVRVNSVYLSTEFVPGNTLADLLAQATDGVLPVETACSIFSLLCAALGAGHQVGLLHLDLHPGKIIFKNGAVQALHLADMGMATIFKEAGLSVAGVNVDTRRNLAFMAPEQVAESREPKAAADVFGAAAVLYWMLTGTSPYNFTDDEEPYEIVVRGDIVPLAARGVAVPERLAAVLDRCLLPDPEYRYQNGAEAAAAISQIVL